MKTAVLSSFLMLGFTLMMACAQSGKLQGLKVYTTLPDYADITRNIAGDKAKVESLLRGNENPHAVPGRMSFVTQLAKADLLIASGLGNEAPWLNPLIEQAGNPKIREGSTGYVNASQGIEVLKEEEETPGSNEKASETKEAEELHAEGNPHFNLDPLNGKVVAQNICQALSTVDPANKDFYQGNLSNYVAKLDASIQNWQKQAEILKGVKFVSYHDYWVYFAARFGMEQVDEIEVQPGVEPTMSHIKGLVEKMKTEKVPVIIYEPHYSDKVPLQIASQTGATALKLPIMVGGTSEATTYIEMMNYILKSLVSAVEKAAPAAEAKSTSSP